MSALQMQWLTNHLSEGKISREEFASLYTLITHTEEQAQKQYHDGTSMRVFRLHPLTRLTLTKVRAFKKLAKGVNYLLLLALISVIYQYVEYYQVSGSLPELSVAGFTKVLTQTPRKPLPSDIVLAAEFLSSEPNWYEDYANQFLAQWQALDKGQRQQYQRSHWFRSFLLALSLHIADQRAMAKKGNKYAIQQSLILVNMAKQLQNKSV